MTITVRGIDVADPPDAWERAGFGVDPDDRCRVGGVGVRLVGRDCGTGIVGWSLSGLPLDLAEVAGIPTTPSQAAAVVPGTHPNGVVSIDHIVVSSPDLGRTVAALAAVGAQPRRERDGELGGRPIRQIFFRFGEVIIEVVGTPETVNTGPSSLWGITYTADLDTAAAFFGDRTGPVRPAVQPGRRITTLRHQELGMSVRTALLSAPILGG